MKEMSKRLARRAFERIFGLRPGDLKRQKREISELRELVYSAVPVEKRAQVLRHWWARHHSDQVLDLSAPQTFSAKIQAIKLGAQVPLMTRLADKYAVRSWVAERIGEQYLIPLLGVWDHAADIDFDALPSKFVLKATHGSHWNVVVKDKSRIKQGLVRRNLATWLSTNFAFSTSFQMQYADIPPRILAETYLENASGELYDYKFWCFKGEVRYIQFLSGRKSDLRTVFFDLQWRVQPFTNNRPLLVGRVPKPDNLEEMISVARKLAMGFEFVRVDLYRLDDGTIKFGEMTFTPTNGSGKFDPPEWDMKIGALFDVTPGNLMENPVS